MSGYKVPVKCACGWRGIRVISHMTDSACPQCGGPVQTGYFVKSGTRHVRAWREA